jgi:hypothetical protein
METAQERELLQLQLQGWPFHAMPMPASFDTGSGYTYSGASTITSGGGGGFLLGWEPPFGCFGLGVVPADALLHDLFPLCTCQSPRSVSLWLTRPAMTLSI